MRIHGHKDRRFEQEFALRPNENFATGQAEGYTAHGVGHSDSSTAARDQTALKSFLDNPLAVYVRP